jgi:hypothetical protein
MHNVLIYCFISIVIITYYVYHMTINEHFTALYQLGFCSPVVIDSNNGGPRITDSVYVKSGDTVRPGVWSYTGAGYFYIDSAGYIAGTTLGNAYNFVIRSVQNSVYITKEQPWFSLEYNGKKICYQPDGHFRLESNTCAPTLCSS